MNPQFPSEVEEFRAQVREFLEDYQQLDGYFHRKRERYEDIRELYMALGERNWLALAWPEEVGGLAKPPVYEFVLWDEMAYSRVARPPLGPGIVAKTIIAYGTEAQKRRFLPGLRRGETFFSLGYSEPEAGSDLGGVRTRAVREGDEYVVSGEKRWTSGGDSADFLWVLCRTGTIRDRARSLTVLIIDACSPGISISPIRSLASERFSEVRFDDVRVPVDNRVGEENHAWSMIRESLATERHVQYPPKRVQRDFEDLVAWVRESGRDGDPVVRRRLADLAVELEEVHMLALMTLETIQHGGSSVVPAAGNKLVGTHLCQKIARTALELGAPEGLVRGTMLEFLWRQSMNETIGGGTSEIMRGVVARTALGLSARR